MLKIVTRQPVSAKAGLVGVCTHLEWFAPLLFQNHVFGVFRVKLSAKNNEKRMVQRTLKLGRHGSFSGLFRLEKPQKVHFYPKMRFLGHNHR